jgi:hypothetical protein
VVQAAHAQENAKVEKKKQDEYGHEEHGGVLLQSPTLDLLWLANL